MSQAEMAGRNTFNPFIAFINLGWDASARKMPGKPLASKFQDIYRD